MPIEIYAKCLMFQSWPFEKWATFYWELEVKFSNILQIKFGLRLSSKKYIILFRYNIYKSYVTKNLYSVVKKKVKSALSIRYANALYDICCKSWILAFTILGTFLMTIVCW